MEERRGVSDEGGPCYDHWRPDPADAAAAKSRETNAAGELRVGVYYGGPRGTYAPPQGEWGPPDQSEWKNVKLPGGPAQSEPPPLSVRVAALHRVLDQIYDVLEGDGGGPVKDPGPPVAATAEMSVGRIGEGLDKAYLRLQELRERLSQLMKALR